MKNKIQTWRRYFLILSSAVLAAILVRNFIVTAYRVPTGSMQPALKPGDFIFSFRPAYGLRVPFSSQLIFRSQPERGDLVVFSYPNQPWINSLKRVIALPGDRIQIVNNHLVLNNKPLNYEILAGENEDNPSPEMFELARESDGDSSRVVILEKSGKKHSFGPLVVPPGEIFLLGDNRDTSDDSRYWGTVPLSQISGRAF